MSSLPHLSVVTLPVENVDRSAAFLEAVFGCSRRLPRREGLAYLETQRILIAVCERRVLTEHFGLESDADEFTARSHVVISFQVDGQEEVDDVLRKAELAGARVLRAAHVPEWGGRAAAFRDADGHFYEIVFNPRFRAPDRRDAPCES